MCRSRLEKRSSGLNVDSSIDADVPWTLFAGRIAADQFNI